MGQAILLAQRVVVGQHVVALSLGERTAVGARGELQKGVEVVRFGIGVLALEAAEGLVDPLEVNLDGLHGHRIVGGLGFGEVGVAQSENDRGVVDLLVQRARPAGLGAVAVHFAALIEVILIPGAIGVVGDEVELVPEAVQFLLALVVEDQFHERRVVAPVAHDVVVAGAEKAALVLGIVREVAAAFLHVEGVGEDVGQAREGGFIAGALGGGDDQIVVADARLGHERGPARGGFLVKARVLAG